MALNIKAPPGVKNLALLKSGRGAPRGPRKQLNGPAKSITVRMPPTTLGHLEDAVRQYESDRTEVLKRAVRLIHHCLSGHNAKIVIADKEGSEREIAMVIDGVPT